GAQPCERSTARRDCRPRRRGCREDPGSLDRRQGPQRLSGQAGSSAISEIEPMAELTTLARPYAKAAFELAQPANQLAEWSRMLSTLAAVAQDERVQALLGHPSLSAEAKAQALN